MLLAENQVRKVIRKTIVENNYRINERFYRQLERNLINEGFLQDLASKIGRMGVEGLAILSLASFAQQATNPNIVTPTQEVAEYVLTQTEDPEDRAALEGIIKGDIQDQDVQQAIIDAAEAGNKLESIQAQAAKLVNKTNEQLSDDDQTIDDGLAEIDNMILQTQAEINAGYSGNDVGFERLRVDLADAGI
jgi:hypothetical protein